MEKSLRECKALAKEIKSKGLPADPNSIERRFCDAVANAADLRMMFAHPDAASIAAAEELKDLILWTADREMGASHVGSRTRQ